ncbi:hypothetical protein PoB_004784200 [Plakobranchus ocellatus]|uniref:Uncharacterized protein n=1 Tax=Plakobranchus ocellatus TaxID=259542 RepID=A0AAV4BPP0_9GAST|nr:hypothetical protein PoB_004784200 [Plakobranchus ocellatus]
MTSNYQRLPTYRDDDGGLTRRWQGGSTTRSTSACRSVPIHRTIVAQWIRNAPVGLKGIFCRGFKSRHRRPSLTRPESLKSSCCGRAIHTNIKTRGNIQLDSQLCSESSKKWCYTILVTSEVERFSWGFGGTVASGSALKSAGSVLSRVRALPSAPWPDGGRESLRSPCYGLAKTNKNQP